METNTIIGIYDYRNSAQFSDLKVGTNAGYFVIYFFANQGLLDHDLLSRLYQLSHSAEKNDVNCKHIGPFENLPQLNQYALSVCQEMDMEKVRLFSLDDYNSIIENISTTEGLMQALTSRGNCLLNDGDNKGVKRILKRFF